MSRMACRRQCPDSLNGDGNTRLAVGPRPRQNRPELTRHRQLKRHSGLGLLDPEKPRAQVHPAPTEAA